LPAAPLAVHRMHLIVVSRPLPAAPLAVRLTYLIVVLDGAEAWFSRQAHFFAVAAQPALAAQNLDVASGVDVSLSACAHILDRGAQAGAQTAACGYPTLPQQENITWEISRRAAFFRHAIFHRGFRKLSPINICNAMRHTSACLSRACLWLGSLLWGEYSLDLT